VKFYILDTYVTSVLFFFINKNTIREMKRRASMAPAAAPAIIATWLGPVCFLLGNIVTWGVSIEGLDETSLHVIVEKERHKFPEVLHKIDASECWNMSIKDKY
jgi:hypothetical protein